MAVSTSEEKFNSDVTERMLAEATKNDVSDALSELRQKYLVQVDPGKSRPGRAFRYSEQCVHSFFIFLNV